MRAESKLLAPVSMWLADWEQDEDTWLPFDVAALAERSCAYADRCQQWLQRCDEANRGIASRRIVQSVAELSPLIHGEILHALDGWLRTGREIELSIDPDVAAAVALAAIEQSRRSWLALVEHGVVRATAAAPFVIDLVWLKHEVGRAFPGAAQ